MRHDRSPPDRTPPVQVSESTWLLVDSEIGAASSAATGAAKHYARDAMENWRGRVQKRTEADFIPWFTDYWTSNGWLSRSVGTR